MYITKSGIRILSEIRGWRLEYEKLQTLNGKKRVSIDNRNWRNKTPGSCPVRNTSPVETRTKK